MRDLVGETLSNRYRMISRIAGGGMGEVYRGHDLLLDRTVAVKVLQPNLASDPELVARFKAEARAAARLTHPNVVGVYDWGAEDEHTYYMVMEYVSGTDLRDVLVSRGAIGVEQAVEIAAGVCDALAGAHAGGLVHRDVKPENVLISRTGTVKVADFGIAAVADMERTSPGGAVPGTLRYLSPEQASGHDATSASDIWMAGALLSELITGMPPLQGAGADLIRRRATESPVPPSALAASVPPEVDAIVMSACAVDPGRRFPSAGEMAAALRRVATDLPIAAPLDELLDETTGEIRLPDMHPTDFAPRKVRRTRVKKSRMTAFAILAALILLGGTRAVASFLAPDEVQVPSLVGMKAQQADAKAQELGLDTKVVAKVNDFATRPGTVLSQNPDGGLLLEGDAVKLTVSLGPPQLPVPTIVGLTVENATVRLRTHKLEIDEVTQRFDVEPEGTIIEQTPATGKLAWGESVDIVVSKGPQSIGVPDVTGMSVDKAKETLLAAGFEVTVTEVYSDDIAAGKVVGTVPGGGGDAPEGSTIEIQKSIGPEFAVVVMPDVRNMYLSAARAELEALGLRISVQEVNGGCGDPTVVDSDPLPGEKIRENDRVALFVVC
jgi:eukaryotic-like serine/threonine-protein kinase